MKFENISSSLWLKYELKI